MPCIFCTLISTKSSCAKVKSVHKQCQNQYYIIETHFIHCEEFSCQHSFENNDFSLVASTNFFTNIESHEKKAGLLGLNLTVQGGGQILRSTPLMGDGQ